jgi:hypothetical protein
MTLTLIVAGIVLVMIILVGAIGYWIDESQQSIEDDDDDQCFCPAY